MTDPLPVETEEPGSGPARPSVTGRSPTGSSERLVEVLCEAIKLLAAGVVCFETMCRLATSQLPEREADLFRLVVDQCGTSSKFAVVLTDVVDLLVSNGVVPGGPASIALSRIRELIREQSLQLLRSIIDLGKVLPDRPNPSPALSLACFRVAVEKGLTRGSTVVEADVVREHDAAPVLAVVGPETAAHVRDVIAVQALYAVQLTRVLNTIFFFTYMKVDIVCGRVWFE